MLTLTIGIPAPPGPNRAPIRKNTTVSRRYGNWVSVGKLHVLCALTSVLEYMPVEQIGFTRTVTDRLRGL